jgi:hypothetical protein
MGFYRRHLFGRAPDFSTLSTRCRRSTESPLTSGKGGSRHSLGWHRLRTDRLTAHILQCSCRSARPRLLLPKRSDPRLGGALRRMMLHPREQVSAFCGTIAEQSKSVCPQAGQAQHTVDEWRRHGPQAGRCHGEPSAMRRFRRVCRVRRPAASTS